MSISIEGTDAEVARCKARYIPPGASYLVTRTCYEETFFWHPFKQERRLWSRHERKLRKVDIAPLMINTQGYLLGLGAQRFNIGIHNYSYLSNHNHHNVQDRCGLLPAFYQWHNSLLARTTNRYRGRPPRTCVLSPGSYTRTQLTCKESAMDKLAYTAVQPVKHGIVAHASQWPGLRRDNHRLLEGWIYLRDDEFFFRDEAAFIKDFAAAPREQQVAYLQELAEKERQATSARVAEHVKKLPPGTCIGVDPFSSDAQKVAARVAQGDYTPIVLPLAELRDAGPLVVPRHGKGRVVLPAHDERARAAVEQKGEDATVTLVVPAAAMEKIAKEVGQELRERPLPPAVLLKPEKHPLWTDATDEEYIAALDVRCDERIAEAFEERGGRPACGLKYAKSLSWTTQGTRRRRRQRPMSRHRDGSERLVDDDCIRPNFTATTIETYRTLAAQLKAFRRQYIIKRKAFEAGQRDAVFPFGTYLMMVRFNVACASPT